MSKERIKIAPEMFDIMPVEYQDLVERATYGKEDRGWKDIGTSKELIEEHSLCAGCPESMAFRYILAALPAPEDTVMVGSTGCTSLVFPHVGVHNIHSLFGNQNAVASGLKRALSVRFPGRTKDVVVLAGDGATVDIGLDMTLQAWFRQEKFTTICFDNELYANTGGQESGLMQKGFVAKMAPMGKTFEKVRLPEIARESGCHYVVNCTVSKPNLVEKVIKNAIHVAREIGPTYLQLYTPCILEIGKNSMEGLQEMRDSEKPTERFAYSWLRRDDMIKRRINIRMSGLGGQGAVTAAHVMAMAASRDGKFAISNPFFGAEKRMAPAESYCRIGVNRIWDRGELVFPDVIEVFHPQVITLGKSYTMPFYSGIKENGVVIINSDVPLLSDEDVKRLQDLNVAVFYIAGTQVALEVAGTELSTNMTMIGSVAGITKCVSLEALDGALQERFGKKFVASGGTATLDEAIKKKFAKKEMLLKKNLETVVRAYEMASEWAEKNNVELAVAAA